MHSFSTQCPMGLCFTVEHVPCEKVSLTPDFALCETVANSSLSSFPKPLVIYI